jgi:hypothetical protein
MFSRIPYNDLSRKPKVFVLHIGLVPKTRKDIKVGVSSCIIDIGERFLVSAFIFDAHEEPG